MAIELDLEIVPKSAYTQSGLVMATALKLCILSEEALEGETDMTNQATDTDPLVIAACFSSRLIIGTGKYKDYAKTAALRRRAQRSSL